MAVARCSVFALVLVACGGDVIATPSQSGDQSAGSGAAGDASSGQGGGGVTSSTSSGFGGVGTSSTAGGGGTPAACAAAFIEVTREDGTSSKLGSVCNGDWGQAWSSVPVGYYVSGGPVDFLQSLAIMGCASDMQQSEGLRLFAQVDGPGAYGGNAIYTDPSGNQFPDAPSGSIKLTLTYVGKVGELIEGNYATVVAKDEISFLIQGAFAVCHVEDENLP